MTYSSDVAALDSMSLEELTRWIARFLRTGNSSPIYISDVDRSNCDLLIAFVNGLLQSDHHDLGLRLRDALATLINSISAFDEDSYDYFWDILTAVSRLKAHKAKPLLVPLLNDARFKGKIGRNEDLHYCIIDASVNFGVWKEEIYRLSFDVTDIKYVDVAFKGLYGFDLQLWEKYFPQVVKTIKDSGEKETIEVVLLDLLETTGKGIFATGFARLLTKMEISENLNFIFMSLRQVFPEEAASLISLIVGKLIEIGNNENLNFIFMSLRQVFTKESASLFNLIASEIVERGYFILVDDVPDSYRKGQKAAGIHRGKIHLSIEDPLFIKIVEKIQRSAGYTPHYSSDFSGIEPLLTYSEEALVTS